MMNRRTFLMDSVGLLAAPLVADAQPPQGRSTGLGGCTLNRCPGSG